MDARRAVCASDRARYLLSNGLEAVDVGQWDEQAVRSHGALTRVRVAQDALNVRQFKAAIKQAELEFDAASRAESQDVLCGHAQLPSLDQIHGDLRYRWGTSRPPPASIR